jgi:capsular polysaccharide biosynthesis protein
VTRYLEAFFRHKLLLITPVVLALVIGVWYVSSQPVAYQSSATVWFDTPLPNPSSVDITPQGATPAQGAQLVLQELLGTRQFLVKVGHEGPLGTYLASHHATKRGPTALISKLASTVKGGSGTTAPIDNRIVSTLAPAFTATPVGPQVLRVTMTSWAAGAIPGTLTALISEYTNEVTSVRGSRDQASLAYYKTQLDDAQKNLASANSEVSDYQSSHPDATVLNDPTYDQLQRSAVVALNNYTTVEQQYTQAGLALSNAESAGSVRTLDAPLAPFAISHRKKAIFAGVAALLVGVLVSVLALTALVSMDKTARVEEDLDDVEGLEVVANIEHLREIPAGRSSAEGRTGSRSS